MEDFPGNSKNVTGKNKDKDDQPEKKVERVISGEVLQRPVPLGRKFKSIFFGGEFKGAARYIAADVLLPAFRNMIVDTTIKGVERIVYGESAAARRRHPDYRPRVQYNNPISRMSRDPRERDRAYLPHQPPYYRGARHQIGELILVSREEAELVLERLIDCIDKYDVASVADLYDLVGLPTTHTDNKWGWSFLNSVDIRQTREGYLIDLPPVEAL